MTRLRCRCACGADRAGAANAVVAVQTCAARGTFDRVSDRLTRGHPRGAGIRLANARLCGFGAIAPGVALDARPGRVAHERLRSSVDRDIRIVRLGAGRARLDPLRRNGTADPSAVLAHVRTRLTRRKSTRSTRCARGPVRHGVGLGGSIAGCRAVRCGV